MNDYLVAALLCGLPAFLAARAVRQFHWDSEARERATVSRIDGAVDRYAESDAYRAAGLPVSGTLAHRDGHGDSNSDGAGFYLAEYRESGRRAIHRDYSGPRPGAHALGRDLDFADAAPVKGYDLDGD